MSKMIINYWGDVMCPFCYIGEHILSNILEECDFREEIEVRWMSCLLHVNKPMDEVSGFREHLLEAYDEETANKKMDVLRHLAEKYGLHFGLDQAKVINSSDAARLIKWASEQGLTLRLAQALGKAFFSDGHNVADRETLLTLCNSVGLDRTAATQVLDGEAFRSEIEMDQLQAEKACPNFIPTIYFNHGHVLEGVISPDDVRKGINAAYQDFRKTRQELSEINLPMMGLDSCGTSCDLNDNDPH